MLNEIRQIIYFLYLAKEITKKVYNNGGVFGVLFTDLSEALNCLYNELLIAKLDAYGFDKNALKLVNSYLSNRKQRVKIIYLKVRIVKI